MPAAEPSMNEIDEVITGLLTATDVIEYMSAEFVKSRKPYRYVKRGLEYR